MTQPIDQRPPIGPFAEPRPNMRGRYLIRNAAKARAMAALDTMLSAVSVGRGAVPRRVEQILVANWGHLGDVVTTFGAIATLRERYPGAKIDMIVGRWGRPAVADTGLVDDIHVIDHWGVNRAAVPSAQKRARYRETRGSALRAIRSVGYDVGIDFYPFFPAAHPLFFRVGIPVRVGYTSSGFGPLLSHPVAWSATERPMADRYRDLLDVLEQARPAPPASVRPRRARDSLAPRPAELADATRYIVLHPGAGAPFKDWGVERWRALLAGLASRHPGTRLVLTGAGAGEAATADQLAESRSGCISLAGRIDWEGFVRVVADAALVICPDTATGHVAALFDVPTISIFTGTNSPVDWGPYSDRARVLVRPVLCAPCNRPGCEAMACIRDVTVDEVLAAAEAALDGQR